MKLKVLCLPSFFCFRNKLVDIVRWNLKEAVSKLLVRRTEITYKARKYG